MLYYQFHIGDYATSTPWMSWDEHCAYRMLLDLYYRKEQPIPLERQDVYLLTMARTKRQRAAIDLVLRHFFTETADGWVNDRCERVLEEYRSKAERAQQAGMASVAARRARAQQPDVSGADLSMEIEQELDGRSDDAEQSLNNSSAPVEHSFNGCSTTVQPTNNQEPETKNQKPKEETPLAPSSLPTSTPPVDNSLQPSDQEAGAVISLPLAQGERFDIDEAQLDAWQEAYPAVDVAQQLRHMREWCLSNPKRRKTSRGVRAFVTSWLAREQDRGGQVRRSTSAAPPAADSREAMLVRLEGGRFCTVNQLNFREGVDHHGRII